MAASTPNKKPGLRLIQDKFWYAGALSERKAEQVLTKLSDKGAFLIRDSLLPEADYVLSVKGREDVDHYQITVAPNDECVLNGYTFTNIADAVEFYTENRIGKVFLDPPEEPVVPQAAVSKATGPKIKPAPIATQPLSSQTITNASPVTNIALKNEIPSSSTTAPQNVVVSNAPTELQTPKETVTIESSEVLNQKETPEMSSQDSRTPKTKTENQTVEMKESCDQTPQAKPVESSPPPEQQCDVSSSSTNVDAHVVQQTGPTNPPELTQEKMPSNTILGDGEEAKTTLVLNESKPVETVSSKLDTGVQNEGNAPAPQIETEIDVSVNSKLDLLKNTKDEQSNELKQLPSIGDKKKALEARLRGEVEKTEKKRKAPPPVPKRVSTATDLFQLQTTKTKEDESTPASEVVRSGMKKSPLPAPKKLSIPLHFQQNNEEDSDKIDKKATSPTETPKRLIIPKSLQAQPPPPPLSTHPGLAKKEEERLQKEEERLQREEDERQQEQQQLLQAEAEKHQPQKTKKRSSFFKKKNKESDKEKASVKRTPSLKAEEPVTWEDTEKKKQQDLEETSVDASPPPRPKKVIGVPTLAMSPGLDVSGGGGELESVFKTITKHEWHPEDGESTTDDVASTFDQHSKQIEESSEPEKSRELVQMPEPQKNEVPKQNPVQKKNIGRMTEVNTFHPDGFSTLPEIQETHFTYTTPISTDIYLNTDFLKESCNSQADDTPPRTPNFTMNSSSPSTPQTPTSLHSTASQKSTPKDRKTTPSPIAKQASPSPTPTPTVNAAPSNSNPQQSSGAPQSQSTGSLPTGFVVTSSGSTLNPFSHQQRSLVDVVPGISKKTATLPRRQSLYEEDMDSPAAAGVRVPLTRSNTVSSKDAQSSVPPMNSKRIGIKKKSSIFKKK